MNISLPESVRVWVEEQATLAGYHSVDDYILQLLRKEGERQRQQDAEALLRQAMVEGEDPGAVTDEALQRRKQEIEAKLLEGLASGPATPMTAADWTALRERVQARLSKRNGQ